MTLISPLPDIWYNSIRNSEKRLDSSPVEFVFQLSPEALRSLVAEVRANAQASTTADAVKATIMRAVSVDVVFYDGSPVTVFCPSSTTHETLVAKPDITSAELDTERGHVTLRVTRKLPLSSNHGNRYFRLGFILCLGDLQHVVFTRAVQVLAKQGPSERKQRYWAVAKAEPERPAYVLQRFSSIQGRLYADFDGYSAPLPLSSIAASSRKRPRSGPTAAHTLGRGELQVPKPLPPQGTPPGSGGAADGTVPAPPSLPAPSSTGLPPLQQADSLAAPPDIHALMGGAIGGSQPLPGDGEMSQGSGMFFGGDAGHGAFGSSGFGGDAEGFLALARSMSANSANSAHGFHMPLAPSGMGGS